jgi:ribosomal-protein-alanine N-acetyltransferase
LGFVEEGVMRQWGYWKDAFHDVRLLSLIKSDRRECCQPAQTSTNGG